MSPLNYKVDVVLRHLMWRIPPQPERCAPFRAGLALVELVTAEKPWVGFHRMGDLKAASEKKVSA